LQGLDPGFIKGQVWIAALPSVACKDGVGGDG